MKTLLVPVFVFEMLLALAEKELVRGAVNCKSQEEFDKQLHDIECLKDHIKYLKDPIGMTWEHSISKTISEIHNNCKDQPEE